MIFVEKCKKYELLERDIKQWFDSIWLSSQSKISEVMTNCQVTRDSIKVNINNSYDKISKNLNPNYNNKNTILIDNNQVKYLVRHTMVINELKMKYLEDEWETVT